MKKLALLTIFILILGTMSTSMINPAHAQNDPSILLRIAVQADKQILNQLDKKYGNDIPNNIQILYDKGHASVKSLDESLPDDVEQAKKDFLTSMDSFMQISRIISQSSEKVVVTIYKKSNTDLSSEIDRLEKYVKTMETISKKHDLDVKNDFVKIHNLIQELRNQTNDQNVINNDLIGQIKIILDSVKNKISESSSKHQSNFIKQFLEKLLDKIEKQLTNVQGDNIDQTQIDKGHELILEIRDLLSKNQINSAKIVYSELKELMKNIGN